MDENINKTYGRLTIMSVYSKGSGKSKKKWARCACSCGIEKDIVLQHIIKGTTKSCGCITKEMMSVTNKNNRSWKGHGEISGSRLSDIKNGASKRNISYSLTNDFIWQLFLDQGRKCALTGRDISFAEVQGGETTASLDRIDSSKSYFPGNVQWVHKDANRMKNSFTEENFIDLCSAIVSHNSIKTKNSEKKVLVVGGLGYIGGFLTDHLSHLGYDVTVYDNMLFESRYLKKIKFVYGDVRDTSRLSEILPAFDVVVWLAAIVGDGACAVDTKLTYEINTQPVKWLADNFSGKIVFMSTCSVYGRNDMLLDESAPLSPLSAYATSKMEAEEYLISKRPDSLIFRLGTLFGVGDRHSRLRLDLVANILALKATRGEELSVFGGDQWRPILHVRDVSTAISHCLMKDISGLYNLSYKNFKLSELAQEIIKIIPSGRLKYSELSFEDQRNYKVVNTKILSTGWKPIYDLEFGIKQIQKIISENRIKDTTDPIYSNAAFLKGLGRF